LSKNENAVELILANHEKVDTHQLCLNPNPEIIKLLQKRKRRNNNCINWANISTNPSAIEFLYDNFHKINWTSLSSNSAALDIIIAYPERVSSIYLSRNTSAIHLLMERPELIEWRNLSSNPSAIEILKANQDMIDYVSLSANPAIFEVDYQRMTSNIQDLYEDLLKEVMKPSRVLKERDYDYLEMLFGD
jgi:hypothetical protein